jgi:ribosomal protein S12 methylthiotransferase accessory factor YcaO
MTVEPSPVPDPSLSPAGSGGSVDVAALPQGLDWVSRLPSASAPGFVYLAGACRGFAVGGGGRDLAEATLRLRGETAEVLAQLAPPCPADLPGDPAIDRAWTRAPAPLRIAAAEVATGRPVGVPAAAIFLTGPAAAERAPTAPPASLGLAAGPTREAARRAALLELVERDAAARWWTEGAPASQLDAAAAAAAAALVTEARVGAAEPHATGFLALASPTGVPVVCALSRGAGQGFAFGLKAAPDPGLAALGAALELMQMELALEMARHRAARGTPAAGDAGPLARAALDPALLAALPPRPQTRAPESFEALASALAGRGLAVVVADLPVPGTAPPVAKVFVPGLKPLPGGAAPRPGTPGAVAPLM